MTEAIALTRIAVNGEAHEMPPGSTVGDLLARLGLDKRRVAVEVNLRVIPKAEHAALTLADGDRVEIVTFVGGG